MVLNPHLDRYKSPIHIAPFVNSQMKFSKEVVGEGTLNFLEVSCLEYYLQMKVS